MALRLLMHWVVEATWGWRLQGCGFEVGRADSRFPFWRRPWVRLSSLVRMRQQHVDVHSHPRRFASPLQTWQLEQRRNHARAV